MKKLDNGYRYKSDRIVVTEKLLLAKKDNENIICYAPVVIMFCEDRIVCDMLSKNDGITVLQYLEAFNEAAKLIRANDAGLYCTSFEIDDNDAVFMSEIRKADGSEMTKSNSTRDHIRQLLDLEIDQKTSHQHYNGKQITIIEPRAARKHALEDAATLLGDPANWKRSIRIPNPLNEHRLRAELYTGIAIEYLLALRQKDRNMDANEWITKLAI